MRVNVAICVKSIAALADRVLAMYLGEAVVEGKADEVMSNETVRQVYLGGELKVTARSSRADVTAEPLLQIDDVRVLYGKAQALDDLRLVVKQGEFVSIVGLNGAGKTTLFNTISGLVPYSGDIRFRGQDLRSMTSAGIARAGIVQCPKSRELFGDMSIREKLDLGGHLLQPAARAKQLDSLFELFPILASRQSVGANALRRRAADAGHCPGTDDAADLAGSRRTYSRTRACRHRAAVEGAGSVASGDANHASSRRAERYIRTASC